jgi:CPA2 family monovalent cation:H+ antiporter-2
LRPPSCVALILGFLAERIKVPALVGYLVAGIIIGPGTPGFVADVHLASQLSEIGVMLLMFGVGLHFSLNDLLAVKRIAVPGAVVQMGLATVLGMAVAWWWGWSWGAGLIFGLSLSCASTVVLLKALEARGVLESMNGRIAVGWLVVEDLACVWCWS